MALQNIVLICVSIIVISIVVYNINNQIDDFNKYYEAIIEQDKYLENNLNSINSKYESIKTDSDNLINDVNNQDCVGRFEACKRGDNEENRNCTKKYKIYREKRGNGSSCEYINQQIISCEDTECQ